MMGQKDVSGKVQEVVFGSQFVWLMPGVLVSCSVLLLAYRGLTEEEHHRPLNGFLANVLLQMLPLIALKIKVWSCADRVSLMPMVICKTLLAHVCLGFFRIMSPLIGGVTDRLTTACDLSLLIAALYILVTEFGFTMNPLQWLEHTDVRNLVILACAAAFFFESYLSLLPSALIPSKMQAAVKPEFDMSAIFFTSANYLDIVAFMPVVWRLYQVEELEESQIGTMVTSGAKRQLQLFFLFIAAFYMHDDVLDPVLNLLDEPIAMMGHAAHFMLVLDVMGFFAFQANNVGSTVQEHGEQLHGLLAPDDEDP